MVQDAAEQEHFDRLQNQLPAFMNRRIAPGEAAAAVVRGIEERSPRIFAPRWWRYVSAFRGLINPLLDRRLESHQDPTSVTREIESAADERGAAARLQSPAASGSAPRAGRRTTRTRRRWRG